MSDLKKENITDEELSAIVAQRKAKREADANAFDIDSIKPGMSAEDSDKARAAIISAMRQSR